MVPEKTLDLKFQKKMDDQLEKIDSRFLELKNEIIHQFHVIFEDIIRKLQLVEEGLTNLDEKLNRRMDDLEKKNEEQHKDILAALKCPGPYSIDGSQPLSPK